MRVGGHRQIGQQQAGQVAAIGALLHEQAAFDALTVLTLDMEIQPGLHIQLRTLGLLAQPLAVVAQVLELPAQTIRQWRQTQGQRLRLAATRHHHLQVDEVFTQALLAIVPLRQLDALAQGNVVDVRRRQVEVQLQPAALAHALLGQGQFVEVLGDPRGVQVFAVVGATIQLDMLGPAEQVLQAEDQQAALAGAFLDPFGPFWPNLLSARRGQQVAFALLVQLAGLRLAEIFCRVQPQRQWPGGQLAAREMLDTARFA
ncbi:hypothetical protein D9M68_619700 [compost metagenome]